MSGAEFIVLAGLLASVTQLLVYSKKGSSWFYDVFTRYRRDSGELRNLYDEACNVHSLAKKVHAGTPFDEELSWFVQGCTTESKALIDLIGSLRIKPQDPSYTETKLDRIHTAIEWKTKEQKIKRHLENIDRYKSGLLVCQTIKIARLLRCLSPPEISSPPVSNTTTFYSFSRATTMIESARLSTLPVLRTEFIGQDHYLHNLETKLLPGGRGALVGLGGGGKSRLALEYARRLQPDDYSTFWLRADNEDVFEQSFLQIGRKMVEGENCPASKSRRASQSASNISGNLNTVADTRSIDSADLPDCNEVKRYLESPESGPWIIVVDNLDSDASLFGPRRFDQLLPLLDASSRNLILFTTRDKRLLRDLVANDGTIQLEGLLPKDAEMLLLEKSKDPNPKPDDVTNLVALLTYSPLAIIQAGSYIAEYNLKISDYLQLYKQDVASQAKLLGHQQIRVSADLPAMKVWGLSFERLKQEDALASHLLQFMACLACNRIPQTLLPKGNNAPDSIRALRALEALFFIEERENEELYDLHPLIQLAVRNQLRESDQLENYLQLVLTEILHVFPEYCEKFEHFTCASSLLPHAQEILRDDNYKNFITKNASCVILASRVTNFLREQGSYESAVQYAKLATELSTQIFGDKHGQTLTTESHLSVCLRKAGKLREAESIATSVLEKRDLMLGANHADTLASQNNLAIILSDQGMHREAENLYRQTVMAKEELLGANHEDTLTTWENLAITLEGQRKLGEAEHIFRRVLEWRQQNLGPHHLQTLSSFSNLGTVLQIQERWEDAWEMHTTAFVGRSDALGHSHPETINSRANLAAVLQCQGKYDAAEIMAKSVLELRNKRLGKYHPDTLKAMRNMAGLLHCQKRYREAEQMSRQAYLLAWSVLGEEHPQTLAAKKHADGLKAWLRKHPKATASTSTDVD